MQECNSKTAPMGGDILGDVLTRKLKNTDATSHLHNDQRNILSAAQISARICSDMFRSRGLMVRESDL